MALWPADFRFPPNDTPFEIRRLPRAGANQDDNDDDADRNSINIYGDGFN